MASVNKVTLIGNVGTEPEVHRKIGGVIIANLTLATSERWKDKATGENKEATEWHRVVFFGRVAEIVDQYVRKGSSIYIEGSLRTRKWQDKSGHDRYTTEINAKTIQMLDKKESASRPIRTANENNVEFKKTTTQQIAQELTDDDIPF